MPAPGLRMAVKPFTGDPSPYGILGGCAGVVYVEGDDLHSLNGTDLTPITGADTGVWVDCPQPPYTNPNAKTFSRVGSCSFDPVTVYSGVTCSTFGISFEESQNLALEQLRMGEQRALEAWFQRYWLCTHAVDLTPASGVLSVPQSIGVLENWLATEYGGQGVIHAPAGAGALMSASRVVDCACSDGGPLSTYMGNCVILGSGYAENIGPAVLPATGCVVAPSGQAYIYITPPVRVRRDQPHLVSEQERQTVNSRTNDRFALAESTFVVELANCIAAVIRTDLKVCP